MIHFILHLFHIQKNTHNKKNKKHFMVKIHVYQYINIYFFSIPLVVASIRGTNKFLLYTRSEVSEQNNVSVIQSCN